MMGRAAALVVMLALGAMALPAQASVLRVTINGFGFFDVDTTTPPATEVVLGFTLYQYNSVTDLSIVANGVTFTESDILPQNIVSGGNVFQLATSTPLAAGILPSISLNLAQAPHIVSLGGLDVGTSASFASDLIYTNALTGDSFVTPLTGSVAAVPTTAVPEPGTLALLGVGMLGLIGARRRRS